MILTHDGNVLAKCKQLKQEFQSQRDKNESDRVQPYMQCRRKLLRKVKELHKSTKTSNPSSKHKKSSCSKRKIRLADWKPLQKNSVAVLNLRRPSTFAMQSRLLSKMSRVGLGLTIDDSSQCFGSLVRQGPTEKAIRVRDTFKSKDTLASPQNCVTIYEHTVDSPVHAKVFEHEVRIQPDPLDFNVFRKSFRTTQAKHRTKVTFMCVRGLGVCLYSDSLADDWSHIGCSSGRRT